LYKFVVNGVGCIVENHPEYLTRNDNSEVFYEVLNSSLESYKYIVPILENFSNCFRGTLDSSSKLRL